MKYIYLFLFLFSISLVLPAQAFATTKYVSPQGQDVNDGSEKSPWRTIQKAADNADTEILVQEGDYNENVNIKRPRLIFRALGLVKSRGFLINTDDISISGFDVNDNGIQIQGNRCNLENNNIRETRWEGIRINRSSRGCRIRNNKIRRARRTGITAPTTENTDTIIENNEITETIPEVTASPITVVLKKGDANSDGLVNNIDFKDFWLINYLKALTGFINGDFDSNGKVDGIDYVIWLKNYDK